MRALTYDRFGGPLTIADLPAPSAPDGGALVLVAASGLCRSDWHGWMGHDSDIVTFPHVPGHEFAGTVVEVGAGVDSGWLGRAVTAPFVFACGDCAVCRAGDGQVCPNQRQPGFSDPGSFAELVVVHAAQTNLVELPQELDPVVAAGLGCRVATAYRGLVHRAGVTEGERVAVFGCGGVGLAAIAIARSRGAEVVAVDPGEAARSRALDLGAAEVVAPEQVGGGFTVTVDAVGSAQVCRSAVLALARRGRHVQIGLLPPALGAAPVPMDRVIAWELDILGSHGMAARDYAPLLADITAGRLDLTALQAPGPPVGLAEAARLLPGLGTAASAGIVLIDPSR